MNKLSEKAAHVGRHYNEKIFKYEVTRSQCCPVEFAITSRQLERWIPERATVAEIGVGSGHYTELLAGRGCKLHLVDVSARLLNAALSRLEAIGCQEKVIGCDLASATSLDCLESSKFDAVLMLGPIYHLCELEERQLAVGEAARILRSGGLLFAAGINRLSYLRDLFRESPDEIIPRREFHERYLRDGNLDPLHAAPIGFANLTTISEFRDLFGAKFEEVILMGVESFANVSQQMLLGFTDEQSAAWLDLIEQSAATPEALGMSDHFLYIGRRRSE